MNPAILSSVITTELKKKFPDRNISARIPVNNAYFMRFAAMEDGNALASAELKAGLPIEQIVREVIAMFCEAPHFKNPSALGMAKFGVEDFLKKEFPDAGFTVQAQAPNAIVYTSSSVTYVLRIRGKNAAGEETSAYVAVTDETPAEVIEMVRAECNAILGKVLE